MPALGKGNMMARLDLGDFARFFQELWGQECFPWQRRLAAQVCEHDWPDYIDLPTASGKTACLDVAVFALALQGSQQPAERKAGCRIFFIVNRRVIVDEAHARAVEMARRLNSAQPGSILHEVAEALREVSGDAQAPPLDVAILRGGIVRDNRWARSITQPTIITSTIDQVGSRLLFRGYGVTDAAKPLHAALVAHDSLLLLDEAHISRPFVETLQAVTCFRSENWAKNPIRTPFSFVQMTATPSASSGPPFTLDQEDRIHPVLQARHGKSKPVQLRVAEKAKGKKGTQEFAKALAASAVGLLNGPRMNIALVVNRIATARMVARELPEALRKARKPESDVHLAIGRMRPIDRDRLTTALQARVGRSAQAGCDARPMFVVATQCLEVGADFDFDAMVSECASLDALRQRFGRLNRRGRDMDAAGVIVIRADQIEEEDDPVYGSALAKTWAWLRDFAPEQEDTVDFGVHAMETALAGADISGLLAPPIHAPVMFPAYVDAWAQTHPMPAPDPDVSLFLHGPQRGEPDVQVCWRDDLEAGKEKDWVQTVSLCPPSSPECMSVPIGVFRNWLVDRALQDEERSDLADGRTPELENEELPQARPGVIWRGLDQSALLKSPRELRPGDTVVLPASAEGWDVLGHVPEHAAKDVAEDAFRLSQGRTLLRLRPQHLQDWPDDAAVDKLREWLNDPELNLGIGDIRALLQATARIAPEGKEKLAEAMRTLAAGKNGVEWERYPDGLGAVFRTRYADKPHVILPGIDDGDDLPSRAARTVPVPLDAHLQHVMETLEAILARLPLQDLGEAVRSAARMHDWGKADERFQALLINGDLDDAWAQPVLWAKSGNLASTALLRKEAHRRSALPTGFRHEMLSVQLAELAPDHLPADTTQRDLALHLIAAHHGRGRPFAPVVLDDNPPDVGLELPDIRLSLTAEVRKHRPPHRLDSGIAERFWSLTRHFGWWGLAYLEAVLRLSDQRASQNEDTQEDNDTATNDEYAEARA